MTNPNRRHSRMRQLATAFVMLSTVLIIFAVGWTWYVKLQAKDASAIEAARRSADSRRLERLFATERDLESHGAEIGDCWPKGVYWNWIDLKNWHGSNHDLHRIRELQKLIPAESMYVRLGPDITDSALSIVIALPQLRRLEISDATFDANEVEQLRKSLPGCEIGEFEWCALEPPISGLP